MLSYFAIWLFLWDDEIDEKHGSLADDFDGAQRYRQHTIAFVEHSLSLKNHRFIGALHPKIVNFDSIGRALCLAYTVGELINHRLMDSANSA